MTRSVAALALVLVVTVLFVLEDAGSDGSAVVPVVSSRAADARPDEAPARPAEVSLRSDAPRASAAEVPVRGTVEPDEALEAASPAPAVHELAQLLGKEPFERRSWEISARALAHATPPERLAQLVESGATAEDRLAAAQLLALVHPEALTGDLASEVRRTSLGVGPAADVAARILAATGDRELITALVDRMSSTDDEASARAAGWALAGGSATEVRDALAWRLAQPCDVELEANALTVLQQIRDDAHPLDRAAATALLLAWEQGLRDDGYTESNQLRLSCAPHIDIELAQSLCRSALKSADPRLVSSAAHHAVRLGPSAVADVEAAMLAGPAPERATSIASALSLVYERASPAARLIVIETLHFDLDNADGGGRNLAAERLMRCGTDGARVLQGYVGDRSLAVRERAAIAKQLLDG